MKIISLMSIIMLIAGLAAFKPKVREQSVETLTILIEKNDSLIKRNNETLKKCVELHLQPQITDTNSSLHTYVFADASFK